MADENKIEDGGSRVGYLNDSGNPLDEILEKLNNEKPSLKNSSDQNAEILLPSGACRVAGFLAGPITEKVAEVAFGQDPCGVLAHDIPKLIEDLRSGQLRPYSRDDGYLVIEHGRRIDRSLRPFFQELRDRLAEFRDRVFCEGRRALNRPCE